MDNSRTLVIRPQTYASGSVIFKQGDNSRDVYILNNGKIGVYVDEIEVAIITTKGVFIGESAALLDEPRNATCIVLMDSSLTVLPGKYLDTILRQNAEIGYRLLKVLAKRLQVTTCNFTAIQKALVSVNE